MVVNISPADRSRVMASARGKDTRPELKVRSAIHQMGYRSRLHRKGLPGRSDLVFPRRRSAIFVHGYFWHRHSEPSCPLARLPKSRLDFLAVKLETIRKRDSVVLEKTSLLGWKVLVLWECELANLAGVRRAIRRFLGPAGREVAKC
jgi:DNA mismatch endonuclease (patch repair protein)